MYTTNKVLVITVCVASFSFALPILHQALDMDKHSPIVEVALEKVQVAETPPYLTVRDEEFSDLETRDMDHEPIEVENTIVNDSLSSLETRDDDNESVEIETPGFDSEIFNLESREVPDEPQELEARANDPYGGKYAPSEATRQQELHNVSKGLSPDGKTGKQVAKQAGLKYDGDNGKHEYLEIANKGALPKPCGAGCQNSIFSKASRNSQIHKAQKAGDYSHPYAYNNHAYNGVGNYHQHDYQSSDNKHHGSGYYKKLGLPDKNHKYARNANGGYGGAHNIKNLGNKHNSYGGAHGYGNSHNYGGAYNAKHVGNNHGGYGGAHNYAGKGGGYRGHH